MITRSTRAKLFAIYLAVLVVGLIFVILRGVRIETDILKLIPQSRASKLSETVEQFSRTQTGEMVFLFTAPSDSAVVSMAKVAQNQLKSSKLFSSISGTISESEQNQWFDLYFPPRFTLLSNDLREQLRGPHGGENLTRFVERNLYAPIPDFYGATLEQDPLSLFPSFMQNLFSGESDLVDGFVVLPYDSLSAIAITATLNGSPFAQDVQTKAETVVNSLKVMAIKQGGTCRSTGIVRFAAASFDRAKMEMSIIGSFSMISIIVILLLAFRSVRLIAAGFMPILLGTLAGFVVTALFFPNLHVIALSMGGSLAGIASDYSLHFLAAIRWSGDSPETVVKKVFPGITLGMITTLIGYAALAFGGFPGLQQIALFTASGLIGAWIAVILGMPLMTKREKKIPLKMLPPLPEPLFKLVRIVLPITLVIVTILGFSHYRTDDSLQALRSPLPALDSEELAIRKVSQGIESSRFVVVNGTSREEILQNCERATPILDSMVNAGDLAGYMSISSVIPSVHRQNENRELLRSAVVQNGGAFKKSLTDLGFDPTVNSLIDSQLASQNLFAVDRFLASPISKPWRSLFVKTGDRESAIILLRDVKNSSALKTVFCEGSAIYLDRIEEISSTLGNYRHIAGILLCVSYGFILILLMIRYGPIRGAKFFLTSVLAGAAVIGGILLSGTAINFMHIMAILMVLAIGIDCTIFFAEGADHDDETVMAVVLSAVSTVLAFGILFLSTTPALRAIGQVITPGIILSVALAILFREKKMYGDSQLK